MEVIRQYKLTKNKELYPWPVAKSLQDPFLNALRKERVPVSIYLVNGIKLQGQIDSFDQFVVLLRNSVSQMVYKHAHLHCRARTQCATADGRGWRSDGTGHRRMSRWRSATI